MSVTEIYASSNGDRWVLVEENDVREVEHRANLASGGAVSRMDVASFLAAHQNGPEQVALRDLLAKRDATEAVPVRENISIIDEVERMGDEIEERAGPHSDPAY